MLKSVAHVGEISLATFPKLMLKRGGQLKVESDQLNLFDFVFNQKEQPYEPDDLSHPVRTDGPTALGGISPENGQTAEDGRAAGRGSISRSGDDTGRDGNSVPDTGARTESDTSAGPRSSVGIDPGEIYTPASRERLNTANYRIRPEDGLGAGSLKKKCRDNLAAIEMLRQLDHEQRPATDEEKRILVKYVGWGGIPQVFAWQESSEWESEREALKNLLTPEEYEAARASTLNAHYTSPPVISGIYEAVQHLGFKSGRILEPSVGIGHFFGLMPVEMSTSSKLTGIEIDPLTAGIAQKLYPDAHIRTQGFEKATLPDSAYDLVISNVPFGNYKLPDPLFDKHNFLIHDYFFAKGLEKVRPGGLLVFITSKGTLDKAYSGLRDYLHDKVNFIGAIRLPNTAFKENANTEVTTDIIFLRRLATGERPSGPDWLNLEEHINAEGSRFQINEYFVNHPEMMLGTMAHEGTMYRANEPALIPDERNLADALREAVAHLPSNVIRLINEPNDGYSSPKEEILAPEYAKENAFIVHDGAIAVRTGATLTPVKKLPLETGRRIRGLIKVREAVRDALRSQLQANNEEAVLEARRLLNFQYDYFVSRFGPINERANRRAFRGDPDLPLLCSLEDYNEETKTAVKTAIFHERTIHQPKIIQAAETAQDALILTLNEAGRVDLVRIERLLKCPPETFLPELKGLIYRNPQTEQWETEDQYLSGNVRSKLATARAAAEADPSYKGNVEALEAVQPADLSPTEIEARLGAAWIPVDDIRAFAQAILKSEDITISHAATLGTWFVKGDYSARGSVANTTEWGTGRYSALHLLQDALNLKIPTVYDRDLKTGASIINPQETEAARDKLEKIKEQFKVWIWEDDERRERLCRKYNVEYNSTRLRVFDGRHLTLPASSQHVTLRPHQKNGIWRIIQSENTLLAHVVGAGKTYTMVGAGIELKRLGLANKPMFVVPNHMLAQFSTELLNLYPTANILAAGKGDFDAANRARLFSRIATGNWDAVIVTHASFEKIPLAMETRQQFIKDQIHEIEAAIREQYAEKGTRVVKELERIKKRLTTKLEALSADEKKDNTLTFEELGIDRLFVDEAHKFKNLFYVTKMTRIAGLPQTASERAFDMFLKVRHIQEKNAGGGVVFATGTPISNTMAEMFTMQRYLQMDILRENSLQHFDGWAGTFGEAVTSMELSPDGSGYRLQSRFARFVNVPELMQQFRQMADVQTAEMLKLPIPKLDQGKPIVISAPTSPELKRFVDTLVARTEAIKSGRVDPGEDNMLQITTEGRKAALDLRLIFPGTRDSPDSKVNLAVRRIHKVWLDSSPHLGTQMVFCDLSTPQAATNAFSVYSDIRSKLIAQGIPSEQIAFIQNYDDDAAKASLFKAVREGSIRILLGSTLKMGEGTNVQKRLIALHHLDAPWRPSDIEQREGRILRQGNENEYVQIYRYVTEGSFDGYLWQTLETKCRFISQVMTGDATARKAEDVDAAALTYAEVKAIASGNPLIIEKASIDAEVMRLTRLKRQHTDSLYQIRYRIKSLKERADICEREVANIEQDLRTRTDTRGEAFAMTIRDQRFTERVEAGRQILSIASILEPHQTTKPIGKIAGFPISIQRHQERINILIHGKNKYTANVSESVAGTIASLEHTLSALESRLKESNDDLAIYRRQRSELALQLAKPFEHETKLANMVSRQQEIVAALDITKNQANATVGDVEHTERPAEEKIEEPQRNRRTKSTSLSV